MVDGLNRVDGLASGIPSQDLIDATIEAARIPALLKERRAEFMGLQQEAVRTLNLRLLSAQLDTSDLRQGRAFRGKSATVSNESVASARATSSAVAGSYSLTVNNLAVAEQRATAGIASATTSNGTGTLTLQIGDGAQTTIDLSDGATSLNELATRINDADAGITAFVIDDGTGSTSQRLVLQSDESGTDNIIKATGTGDMATLFGTDSSSMSILQAGLNASLSLGTLNIESASNTIENVVPGVELELKDTGSLTVTVGANYDQAEQDITDFVESLNSALSYFRENSGYDIENEEAGLLFNEGDLRRSLDSMVSSLVGTVSNGSISTLFSIGITFNSDDGTLDLDAERLRTALQDDPEGVQALFANSGDSSNPGVQFAVLDQRTQLPDGPLSIDVTQVAEQASFTGSDLAASTTIIEGFNDTFEFRLGTDNYTVTLATGTYDRDAMATQVEAAIGQVVGENQVAIERVGDALQVKTEAYGATAVVGVLSGSNAQTLTDLGFSVGNFLGKDVAGTINGEVAVGAGRSLSAAEGSDLEGLALTVTASTTLTNVSMTVQRGIGQIANEALANLTDSADGLLTQKDNFFGSEIEFLNESIADIDANLATMRSSLDAQFLAMERTIASLQSQEQFLVGQIAAFQNMAAARAGASSR